MHRYGHAWKRMRHHDSYLLMDADDEPHAFKSKKSAQPHLKEMTHGKYHRHSKSFQPPDFLVDGGHGQFFIIAQGHVVNPALRKAQHALEKMIGDISGNEPPAPKR